MSTEVGLLQLLFDVGFLECEVSKRHRAGSKRVLASTVESGMAVSHTQARRQPGGGPPASQPRDGVKVGSCRRTDIRGRALVSLQKPREAIADFRKAMTLSPDDAAIHFQMVRGYRLTGQEQEAQNENAIYERLDKEAHAARVQPNPP